MFKLNSILFDNYALKTVILLLIFKVSQIVAIDSVNKSVYLQESIRSADRIQFFIDFQCFMLQTVAVENS